MDNQNGLLLFRSIQKPGEGKSDFSEFRRKTLMITKTIAVYAIVSFTMNDCLSLYGIAKSIYL